MAVDTVYIVVSDEIAVVVDNTSIPGAPGLTTSVNGVEQIGGNVTLTKAHLELGNADNTSDADKPVSAAAAVALGNKEPKLSSAATSSGLLATDEVVSLSSGVTTRTPWSDVALLMMGAKINDIGNPGTFGYGVGVCPSAYLPSGMTPLPGYMDSTHDNRGNYIFSDGSVMCYVPKFYYKVGTGANGLAANTVDTQSAHAFLDTSAANAAGYALHRAFIDGGVEQPGFFVDKYKCSKNASGTGFIASSLKNGNPISTAADHNPIGGLTAVAGINAYYAAITAAKARDGVNGEVNPVSIFFCSTRFIQSALAILSLAHSQASAGTGVCAWWVATGVSAPRGCNNNALKDANDSTVTYLSDGYSNCGKTGSATPFAKTTHTGQNCGVADLNGLMYEINPCLTCITSTKAITGITQAATAVVSCVGHGKANGTQFLITNVVGMTQVNATIATVANATADTFELAGVNSTGFTAYTSGGTMTFGTFYVHKNSASQKTLTAGNTLTTDLWGATGVAAHSDVVAIPFANGACAQYFGNAANQVLSEAVSGDAWKLAGLGFPKAASGVSAAGSSLFGNDYFYEYFTNDMVPISCLSWNGYSAAGVWGAYLNNSRPNAYSYVGFRSACYPA